MKKGTVVLVKAEVRTGFHSIPEDEVLHTPRTYLGTGRLKKLYKHTIDPYRAIVVGHSYLATGRWQPGWEELAELVEDRRHSVVLVEPLQGTRYLKPRACLEEDLELLDFTVTRAIYDLREEVNSMSDKMSDLDRNFVWVIGDLTKLIHLIGEVTDEIE